MGSMNMHYSQRILNLSTGAVVARSSQFMRHVSHRPFPNKPPDYRTLYMLIVDLVGVVLCIVYAWCFLGRRPLLESRCARSSDSAMQYVLVTPPIDHPVT